MQIGWLEKIIEQTDLRAFPGLATQIGRNFPNAQVDSAQ